MKETTPPSFLASRAKAADFITRPRAGDNGSRPPRVILGPGYFRDSARMAQAKETIRLIAGNNSKAAGK